LHGEYLNDKSHLTSIEHKEHRFEKKHLELQLEPHGELGKCGNYSKGVNNH
jgi:hypothetical protein